jgi:hypothetical protein
LIGTPRSFWDLSANQFATGDACLEERLRYSCREAVICLYLYRHQFPVPTDVEQFLPVTSPSRFRARSQLVNSIPERTRKSVSRRVHNEKTTRKDDAIDALCKFRYWSIRCELLSYFLFSHYA